MSARVVYLLLKILMILYSFLLMRLQRIQNKKPLPEEVSDIYSIDRYQRYLDYTSEKKRLSLISTAVDLFFDTVLIFSPIYGILEEVLHQNVYLIVLLTIGIFILVEFVTGIPLDYCMTFRIEEKYGMNKKDKKEFIKDEILELIGNLILMSGLCLLVTFAGEHMAKWTKGYNLSVVKAIGLSVILLTVFLVFILLASLFSLFLMKKRYTFTPLEEGDLKDRIIKLQEGSRKKVKRIYVYNESKKSNSKNAALLKILWHREFWIADNFMNENAERELLAVLSHEIGHLKHRKNLLNYLTYAGAGLLLILFVYLIVNPGVIFACTSWIRASFDITLNNYYILLLIITSIASPLGILFGVFSNYRSRSEEYEADREAVKNGYAEELIHTFKEVSHDELINVFPHPFVEFMEYDHPGMYNRIKAIEREAEIV